MILKIYNNLFSERTFPDEWREYLVFFIPKQGNNKFRPISLSSCLCKTMERLITNRLIWWLEFNRLIPESQYGFRKQKSCMDNLMILYTDVQASFLNKKNVPAAFLDIKSAYDHVLPDVLINILDDMRLPILLKTFIYNSISCRRVSCRYQDIDECRMASRGLPWREAS